MENLVVSLRHLSGGAQTHPPRFLSADMRAQARDLHVDTSKSTPAGRPVDTIN